MSAASRPDGPMTGVSGAPVIRPGAITSNPVPEGGPPSAWIEMAASAWARLPIAARWVTHGPTPSSLWRVRTTVAPSARSSRARRIATSNVKACSGYPASVCAPVVSQAFHSVITLTSLSMIAG